MSIINVTDWERQEYAIGTRKKFLYIHPATRQRAFFKYPIEDQTTGEKAIGEIWSEKIAADIGRLIGISTAVVEIGENEDGYGSLSYSFLMPGEELHHGAEFLAAYFDDFDPRNLKQHRLDLILKTVKAHNLEEQFADLLVFDALIGNSDRHSENWGLISNSDDCNFTLAPAYDNSSSLSREFKDDNQRLLLLRDGNRLYSYIFGSKSTACISMDGNTKRTQHFQLINALLNMYPKYVNSTLDRLTSLRESLIDQLLSGIFGLIMSDVSKDLVRKVLLARRGRLLEMRRTSK